MLYYSAFLQRLPSAAERFKRTRAAYGMLNVTTVDLDPLRSAVPCDIAMTEPLACHLAIYETCAQIPADNYTLLCKQLLCHKNSSRMFYKLSVVT